MKTSVPESLFSKAEACNFFKKETLAYVFSCEFSETAKTTFTYRIHLVAAAVMTLFLRQVKPFHKNKNGLIFQKDYL